MRKRIEDYFNEYSSRPHRLITLRDSGIKNGTSIGIKSRGDQSLVISSLTMFQRRGSQLCIVLAIAFCVAAQPPHGVGSPWASYAGKPGKVSI